MSLLPPPLRRLILLAAPLLPALASLPVSAQEEVPPLLFGQVLVGSEPLEDGIVLLHQVSAEASGEIDSVRVEVDGTFQFFLPYVPDHTVHPEIFFASIEYRGLLYFGPALTDAIQLDSLYLIQAYDTVSVPEGGGRPPPDFPKPLSGEGGGRMGCHGPLPTSAGGGEDPFLPRGRSNLGLPSASHGQGIPGRSGGHGS
ncbi:hypothetical protein ACFL5A_02455 [Gemmatimonadota bacterium]